MLFRSNDTATTEIYTQRYTLSLHDALPIARAVVHEPKLVLADEPTGNLDAETAHHVLELLRRTCGERNATLIVATHGAELAARAARVVTIRAGRIEDFGS